jgi:ABC-2 type transport system permease protein
MLWYKAWLETRARFLTSLSTFTIFCGFFIHHALYISCSYTLPCKQGLARPGASVEFYRLLFITHQYLAIIWILVIVLLGMGGIVREKATGVSSLTLSLPVSRRRLLGVRIGLGILQAIVLGVVPWATILLVSTLAREPILITQVGFYVLLLVGGGIVYFAMAVLVSSAIEGEYTAPAVTFGLIFLSAILFDAWLRRFNLWRLVSGDFYLDGKTYLLTGPVPWVGIVATLSVAAIMLVVSVKIIERREF